MSKRLTKLSPKHIAAARLRVEGRNNDEIASLLAVKKETLYVWFSDEAVKEEIARQLSNIDEVFALRMADLAMAGLSELMTMARMPLDTTEVSPHQKLEFLREILDRTPATAKVGVANNGGGNAVNNFILPPDMPVDQLVERARQLVLKAGAHDGSSRDATAD